MVGTLTIIAVILAGVVLMFQPITPKPFNLGFDFVLIALLAFNIWSHVTSRPHEQSWWRDHDQNLARFHRNAFRLLELEPFAQFSA